MPSAQEVKDRIYTFITRPQVFDYAKTLSPGERRYMALVDSSSCEFLPAEGRNRYTGLPGNGTLAIRLSDKESDAELEDAKASFMELFGIISSTLVTARENKKALIIHVGGAHTERESLMMERMIYKIVKRLKINHIGFELKEYSQEGKIPKLHGLREWGDYADRLKNEKGLLPEIDVNNKIQPDGRIFNYIVTVPDALPDNDNKVFATDLAVPDAHLSISDSFAFREKIILDKLAMYGKSRNDVLHFGGAWHFHGYDQIKEDYPESHMIYINVIQKAYLCHRGDGFPFEKEAFFSDPAVHSPILNGRVRSFSQAIELSDAADKIVGEELTQQFFQKHPHLASTESWQNRNSGGKPSIGYGF